jgi:lipopolysaccharide assembly outer membrane protein LptD (OstA)
MIARAAAFSCVLALGAVAAAHAQSVDNIGGFDIVSDSIDYNYTTGDYSIPTRFTATNGGTNITADHAVGNSKHKVMTADGNVVVHQTGPLHSHAASQSQGFSELPSTLTCDHLDADGLAKLYTATGHVHFVQGEKDATGDRGTLDDLTSQLHMEGHVTIKDGDQTLSADSVDYNTETGDGQASGNVMVIAPVPPAPESSVKPGSKSKKHHV